MSPSTTSRKPWLMKARGVKFHDDEITDTPYLSHGAPAKIPKAISSSCITVSSGEDAAPLENDDPETKRARAVRTLFCVGRADRI